MIIRLTKRHILFLLIPILVVLHPSCDEEVWSDDLCVIGEECDDGNTLTIDDRFNEDCICIGICSVEGTSCDDGDPTTYNDQITDSCYCAGTPFGLLEDICGNAYRTVRIGDQVWMTDDLQTTCYSNGDPIAQVTGNNEWGSSAVINGAWCYHANDSLNDEFPSGAPISKLYNQITVLDDRGVCPTGWHVPSIEEWEQLIDFLDGGELAGGKLKAVGTDEWLPPNSGADNSSLFSAYPTGWRLATGTFSSLGSKANWWSDETYDGYFGRGYTVRHDNTIIYQSMHYILEGLCIRCLQD